MLELKNLEPEIDPDPFTCPQCGKSNLCARGTGLPCWCANRPVSRELLEAAMGPFSMDQTCLCCGCLKRFERPAAE
jgi:hypothetical protein